MNVKVGQPGQHRVETPQIKSLTAESAEQVAVLVCHGMGQQVPFETISAVANSIDEAAGRQSAQGPRGEVEVRIVKLGAEQLARAELKTNVHGQERSIHVYEAYWAPLTEGKVTLRDVYYFLKDAGVGAFVGCLKDGNLFKRFLFDGWREFEVPAWQLMLTFGLAIAALWSLGIINTVITFVAAARALTSSVSSWPSAQLIADLTVDFLFFLACAAPLVAAYGYVIYLKSKKIPAEPLLNSIIEVLVWLNFVVLVLTGLIIAFHLVVDRGATTPSRWETWTVWRMFAQRVDPNTVTLHPFWITIVWGLLAWLSFKIRWFLIQYVGDVAAYITPHAVSKFFEVRKAIQEISLKVARAILQEPQKQKEPQEKSAPQKDPSIQPFYNRVLLVGHSLGSVVAYDTLNAMLLEDELADGATKGVQKRIAGLVTFGSPLDKTAFIFRNQKADDIIREGLAAAVQPVIADEKFRTFPWVNLYSRQDWISGPLDFYNNPSWPETDAKAVENIPDPDARTPLLAHTEYWANELLGDQLLRAITRV